jgi:hypothetical protein
MAGFEIRLGFFRDFRASMIGDPEGSKRVSLLDIKVRRY